MIDFTKLLNFLTILNSINEQFLVKLTMSDTVNERKSIRTNQILTNEINEFKKGQMCWSLPLHQQVQFHLQELLLLAQYSRQSQAQVPN